MANTTTRTFSFTRYGYDYELFFAHDGAVLGTLFVDGVGFDTISFTEYSERAAHRRVIEEIIAFEECGF